MIESFVLSGDFFALAAVIMINKDFQKQKTLEEQAQTKIELKESV